MRLDDKFSNYTLLIKNSPTSSTPECKLLNNKNGKVYDMQPLSSDGKRFGIKSSNGDQRVNFDIDTTSPNTIGVTILEDGKLEGLTTEYIPRSHRFNFYLDHGTITMDKEHVPSLLKIPTKLRVGKSHGYGIFATAPIKAGEIIEETPMLSQNDPYLTNYTFGYNKQHLLALGFGSLYNHSDNPNVSHSINTEGNVMTFTALRDIPEGGQCTISYGSQYFPSRGIVPELL